MGCSVPYPNWIGHVHDGIYNGGAYNTKECWLGRVHCFRAIQAADFSVVDTTITNSESHTAIKKASTLPIN
jgi:hypothetical protein